MALALHNGLAMESGGTTKGDIILLQATLVLWVHIGSKVRLAMPGVQLHIPHQPQIPIVSDSRVAICFMLIRRSKIPQERYDVLPSS